MESSPVFSALDQTQCDVGSQRIADIVDIYSKHHQQQSYEQGCIICSILPSGMGARGVSSEQVANMEMFSSSPT